MHSADAGIPPAAFWDLTHRETTAVLRAHRRRLLREQRLAIVTGYYAGSLSRAKNIPKLKNLLKGLEPDPPRAQTAREMRAAIIGANSAMGGKVRYVPKGTIRGG